MEHIGLFYGLGVLVTTFTAMIHLYLKFSAPIVNRATSTREGRKKMAVNGLGTFAMFVLFIVTAWLMGTDTFASVGDNLAGS